MHAIKQWLHTLQVLDDVWAEFLKDLDSVKTAVAGRTFAQLDPDDEFRLEAGESPSAACCISGLTASQQSWSCLICAVPATIILVYPKYSMACAGGLYLKTLRRLRHRWVKGITCGPQLYVDLERTAMSTQGKAQGKEKALILDIGPPIHDLDEEMNRERQA